MTMQILNPPTDKKVGGWAEWLRYDRVIEFGGLTWYRVNEGFGYGNASADREDWVLDVPALSVSVTYWKKKMPFCDGPGWRVQASAFRTREEAMTAAVVVARKQITFERERRARRFREALDTQIALDRASV